MIVFEDLLFLASIMFFVLAVFSFFNEKVLHLPTEIGLMTISFTMSLSILLTDSIGLTNFSIIFEKVQHLDLMILS